MVLFGPKFDKNFLTKKISDIFSTAQKLGEIAPFPYPSLPQCHLLDGSVPSWLAVT